MPRPPCPRWVDFLPGVTYFKPAGVPLRELEELRLTLDELEALRLADLLGLYQDEAAAGMQISRATFGRIVESARRKVAEALVSGKALRLEGGPVVAPATREPEAAPGEGRRGQGRRCGWGRARASRGRHGRGWSDGP